MRVAGVLVVLGLSLLSSGLYAGESNATTLVRMGLDQLTAANESIVQARVLAIHSYWNDARNFILTDVQARPSRSLKGPATGDLTFTVMGGTVGDVTTLVVGGARLVPGSEYVLFLAHADLPGAARRLTVRDHAQGIFDLAHGRAYSQAAREPLLPDPDGHQDAPGGTDGIALDELLDRIRTLSHR